MKVAIIEDEVPAAEKLTRHLSRIDSDIEVVQILESVSASVLWLKEHQSEIDLLFMDIQLTDGKSFEIFEQIEVIKPIIFTTAFDEYAIKAFKVNSIDYLLKPVVLEELRLALDKFKSLSSHESSSTASNEFQLLLRALNQQKTYKSRFMVKVGEHIRSVTTKEISFFYAEGRYAYLTNTSGRKLIIDYKLEDLETLLDPEIFFRVNRTFILNIESIKDVIVYSNSRLKVVTDQETDKEIIVSREKVAAFKQWFDGSL